MTISVFSTNSAASLHDFFVKRLFDELSKCKSGRVKLGPVNVRPEHKDILVFDSRKYYDQAINYQKALILAAEGKTYPPFQIHLSDLFTDIKKVLDESLDTLGLESVVRRAVLRIFQDIDNDYNEVFPEDDPDSKKFRINLSKEIAKILRVELM